MQAEVLTDGTIIYRPLTITQSARNARTQDELFALSVSELTALMINKLGLSNHVAHMSLKQYEKLDVQLAKTRLIRLLADKPAKPEKKCMTCAWLVKDDRCGNQTVLNMPRLKENERNEQGVGVWHRRYDNGDNCHHHLRRKH